MKLVLIYASAIALLCFGGLVQDMDYLATGSAMSVAGSTVLVISTIGLVIYALGRLRDDEGDQGD